MYGNQYAIAFIVITKITDISFSFSSSYLLPTSVATKILTRLDLNFVNAARRSR